jgi:hypothetical protein
MNVFSLARLIVLVALISACASTPFNPKPVDEVPFRNRSQFQATEDVRVSVAVPSATETRLLFGAPLYKRGIQPVWLEIQNTSDEQLYFFTVSLDPEYFTPIETSFLNQKDDGKEQQSNELMDQYFFENGMRAFVPAGEKRTGFMFTQLDEGTKSFNVEISTDDVEMSRFTFFVPVPGLRIDHTDVDFGSLYAPDEIRDFDGPEIIEALKALPCCTADKKSKKQGDPLNLVIIGDARDVFYSFIRAGWDETETMYAGSSLKTLSSFFRGSEYRYSPVSALYAFGRSQDVAFQKARGSINERNHLRLWLAPMRYQGKPVWIGQISRDIGVRFRAKTITTHKIDPNVDETREFLLENLAYSQSLKQIGYVGGVGPAPIGEPRKNLGGDAYFTDGYRVVLSLSSQPVAIDDIELLPWEDPRTVK